MNEITIYSGIKGTRQLAAAIASLHIRRIAISDSTGWPGLRRIRTLRRAPSTHLRGYWSSEELRRALALKSEGKSCAQIAIYLDRSPGAVKEKLGRPGRQSVRRAVISTHPIKRVAA